MQSETKVNQEYAYKIQEVDDQSGVHSVLSQ